jgi:hypothetical protein
MPENIQEEILFTLLKEESGFDLQPLRLEFGLLVNSAHVSPELKTRAAAVLQGSRHGFLQELTANLRGSLQAVAGQLNNIPLPQAKPEFVNAAKDIYRARDNALGAEYERTAEYAAAASSGLTDNHKLFLARKMGLREFAGYLDSLVIALDNIYGAFKSTLIDHEAAHGKNFSRMKNGLAADQARKYADIAGLLRAEYEASGGVLVLKLSPDPYFLVNAALERLDAVPLSAVFCDLEAESAALVSAEELTFLDGCYEYSSQYKSGTAILLDVIVKIIRQDAAELVQWDRAKIDELHKLTAFCGQARSALQDFAKKLESSKELKKMERTQIVFNTCQRFLTELNKSLNSLNKSSSVRETLARYRLLLEDTRWLNTIAVICQYAAPR